MSLLLAAAAASCAAWVYLLLFRGGFWRDGPYLPEPPTPPSNPPAVVAVVPARNEAETIGRTVASLGAQDYGGTLLTVVVDDQSHDGTADRACAAGRNVVVVSGTPLPAGWAGKMWAVAQGIEEARRRAPDARYIWLTDADIEHGPGVLGSLVAKAERGELDLVSTMVMLRCDGVWERLLIPAFIFFFKKLYPFAWSNDRRRETAAAAGGSMLVRTRALDAIGGIARIKDAIIDDCALAGAIKPHGGIWLGLTRQSRSLRPYTCLSDVWNMVARTAFVQLRHSWLLLAGTVIGMGVIYLAPPVALLYGLLAGSWPLAVLGAAGWSMMVLAYRPTTRLYGRSWPEALLLPLAALLYTLMTIASAWRTVRGRGAAWKDRHYGTGAERGLGS